MPRQRSKKLSASRKTEQADGSGFETQKEQIDSENESIEANEKDEEEEELDRLVLGDGTNFRAQLRQHMDLDSEGEPEEGDQADEEEPEVDGSLENVDDSDVRITPPNE